MYFCGNFSLTDIPAANAALDDVLRHVPSAAHSVEASPAAVGRWQLHGVLLVFICEQQANQRSVGVSMPHSPSLCWSFLLLKTNYAVM